MTFAVGPPHFEIVRTTKVILGSRAANGWKIRVTVHVEFDFSFAPPAGAVRAPGEIRTNVLAGPFDSFYDSIQALGLERIFAPELSMQVSGVIGNICQRVVDLVINRHR